MCVCVCVSLLHAVCLLSLQAVNGELVPYLLTLLEAPLVECDKPSATKALIAESLKAMAKDLAYGEKVSQREGERESANVFLLNLCHTYIISFEVKFVVYNILHEKFLHFVLRLIDVSVIFHFIFVCA